MPAGNKESQHSVAHAVTPPRPQPRLVRCSNCPSMVREDRLKRHLVKVHHIGDEKVKLDLVRLTPLRYAEDSRKLCHAQIVTAGRTTTCKCGGMDDNCTFCYGRGVIEPVRATNILEERSLRYSGSPDAPRFYEKCSSCGLPFATKREYVAHRLHAHKNEVVVRYLGDKSHMKRWRCRLCGGSVKNPVGHLISCPGRNRLSKDDLQRLENALASSSGSVPVGRSGGKRSKRKSRRKRATAR